MTLYTIPVGKGPLIYFHEILKTARMILMEFKQLYLEQASCYTCEPEVYYTPTSGLVG
jgi:hypothetical protein